MQHSTTAEFSLEEFAGQKNFQGTEQLDLCTGKQQNVHMGASMEQDFFFAFILHKSKEHHCLNAVGCE